MIYLKTRFTYPFYKSLRFRLGLLFSFIFLALLSGIMVFVYRMASDALEKYFMAGMVSQARLVLQKTSVTPLAVPLPQAGEYFLVAYNSGVKNDTIFNNLPAAGGGHLRRCQLERALETGGKLEVAYAASGEGLDAFLRRLRQSQFVLVPLAFLVSLSLGYSLSGFMLLPVTRIINKANEIDLQNETALLNPPAFKDELFRLTEALNRMLARINKQSREQVAFFASASHELRTPLSNMLTQLQVLEAQAAGGELQKLLAGQVEEVRRLSRVVDGFLLMGQLKAGSLQPCKTMVDLVELCVDSVGSNGLSTAARLKIYPEEGSFLITADKQHVRIILDNLFRNALKYHKPGTTVYINFIKVDSHIYATTMNEAISNISDTENLGKEFTRHGISGDGAGLGLWISGQLAALNGADFGISARDGTFTATLVFPAENINQ